MDGIKLFSKKRKRTVKRDQATAQPAGGDKVAEQPAKLQKLTAARLDRRPSDRPDAEASELCNFRDLGVSEWLELVCNSLGMKQPTQVGLWFTEHAVLLLALYLWTCSVPCCCSRPIAGATVDPLMCHQSSWAAVCSPCSILWKEAGE